MDSTPVDTDDDGLSDYAEVTEYFTLPDEKDSDSLTGYWTFLKGEIPVTYRIEGTIPNDGMKEVTSGWHILGTATNLPSNIPNVLGSIWGYDTETGQYYVEGDTLNHGIGYGMTKGKP